MITYARGDYGSLAGISIPVTHVDGTAFDLTGKTVHFKAWDPKTPLSPFLNVEAVVINPPADGLAVYTPALGEIDTVGDYDCEAEVSIAGSVVSTIKDKLKVVESA